MRHSISVCSVALCAAMALPQGARAGTEDDLAALLRLMPADFPYTFVAGSLEEFDSSVASVYKRVDPAGAQPWIVDGLKGELGIGGWIDYSKPIGMGSPSAGGAGEYVVWAQVPGFTSKVKSLPDATEVEGVWHLPFEGRQTVFALLKGDYVVAATSSDGLARATTKGKTLADELKGRMDLVSGRDALLHINFEPLRPMVLGSIAQYAPMAPAFAMMVGQQGGGDPAVTTAMINGLFGAVRQFVEQLDSVDVAITLSDKSADITVAAGFNEGAIKTYLAKQKPASIAPLTGFPEQPYFLAISSQVPGRDSPVFDFFMDQISSAVTPPTAAAAGETKVPADATKGAMDLARELYRSFDGFNMVLAMTSGSMRASGDYIGEDPKRLVELIEKSVTGGNPLMQQFSKGVIYESLEERKVGTIAVTEYAM